MSNRLAKLGEQLRLLRKNRRLTLDDLARKAGVSKAMLSQIEHNKINPTVAIILKISDALDVHLGQLIANESRENILRVIRSTDQHYTFRKDRLCEIRTLSPLNLEKSIEFYRINLEPKGVMPSEAHFAGTEEFLYLSHGRLTVTSENQTIVLSKGDAAHYRADVSHTIHNESRHPAEAFLIVRYRETTP